MLLHALLRAFADAADGRPADLHRRKVPRRADCMVHAACVLYRWRQLHDHPRYADSADAPASCAACAEKPRLAADIARHGRAADCVRYQRSRARQPRPCSDHPALDGCGSRDSLLLRPGVGARVGLVWLAAGNCHCAFCPADVGVCRAVRVEIPLSAAEKRVGVCHLFSANDAFAFCNGECRAGAANRHLLLCVWLAAALLDIPLDRLAAEQQHRHENRRDAFVPDAPFRRNRRHIVACAGADAAICASDGGCKSDERCSGESAHQRRGTDVSSAVYRNSPNAASARRDLRNPGCCGLPSVPEPAGAGGRGAVGLLGESGAGKQVIRIEQTP